MTDNASPDDYELFCEVDFDPFFDRRSSHQRVSDIYRLDELIANDPDHLDYRWDRAELINSDPRRYADRMRTAVEDLTKIITSSGYLSELRRAHIDRAIFYERLQDLDAVLDDLGWLIAHDHDAHSWRGHIREIRGDLDGALSDYRTAFTLNPNDGAYGRFLYKLGRYDAALTALNEGLRLALSQQKSGWSLGIHYYICAKTLYKLGRHEESLQAFHEYINLAGSMAESDRPTSAEAYMRIFNPDEV